MKNIFLLLFLSGFILSSNYLPQRVSVELSEYDIKDILLVREAEEASVRELCKSNILPLKAGILLGIAFAGIVKICEDLSYRAKGKFPVKSAGIVGFIVGYALVAIGQYLVLYRFGIK